MSFADVVRKVKGGPNLKAFGEHIMNIRKTKRDELLLKLNKLAPENISVYKNAVKVMVGSIAEIRA